MTKIEREIFAGDAADLRECVEDFDRLMGLFNKGTRIYIAEAPNFRQVVYDLVSRGFNALGFMGVIDVVILLDADTGTIHHIILLHGYDEMGQLSTETIWPLPKDEQAPCAMPPPGRPGAQ
jgi:hypothetical protein